MLSRLRELREDNDLNQTEIAKVLNVSQRTYSSYETGDRTIPYTALIKLARFYNTSVDYILSITDQTKPYPPQKK
ncbi:MAG: helix-turn-helix transcriptional regulator [Clostridia bacterium]|nr:helix-turn-helix transcriptional regulator [Clostridia bacterium]